VSGIIYLNGATLMTTPTPRVLEIARETGYAGIEARAERLLEDAADRGDTASVGDLEKIQGAGKHLLGLINDILDLSKIEAGRMDVYLEQVSLPRLLDEVKTIVDPMVKKNGNALVIECPPGIGGLRTDVTKLKQSLINLLSNAAKFTLASNAVRDLNLLNMLKWAAKRQPKEAAVVLNDVIETADTVDTTRMRKESLAAIDELKQKGPNSKRELSGWSQVGAGALSMGCVVAAATGQIELGIPCVIGGAAYSAGMQYVTH